MFYCICLDKEFFESKAAFYEPGEGVQFDRISVITLRIRTDRHEQTM